MTGSDRADLIYPNPASGSEWTDDQGRVWQRRGDSRSPLDEKRTRRLLRRPDVPMATWSAGEMRWAVAPDAKVAAAERLYAAAVHPGDVVASEWHAGDGSLLLLLEHRGTVQERWESRGWWEHVSGFSSSPPHLYLRPDAPARSRALSRTSSLKAWSSSALSPPSRAGR